MSENSKFDIEMNKVKYLKWRQSWIKDIQEQMDLDREILYAVYRAKEELRKDL